MVKNHLKRLVTPRSWPIQRKQQVFTTRPKAGKQLDYSMPINTVLKELIGTVSTTKEVKALLNARKVVVAGKARHDIHYPVGLFDVITFTDAKESYRLSLDAKGRMTCVPTKDADVMMCKIVDKTTMKGGKTQLNCFNGFNLGVDKDEYKTGDVLLVKENKISKHLPLSEHATCMLVAGKHSGKVGTIKNIADNTIVVETQDGQTFSTLREYAFVIGTKKAEVTV